jgi:hypothetical protein
MEVFVCRGDYHGAGQYYLEGLQIAELTRNEQLQSICIGNLSILNQELGNFVKLVSGKR